MEIRLTKSFLGRLFCFHHYDYNVANTNIVRCSKCGKMKFKPIY